MSVVPEVFVNGVPNVCVKTSVFVNGVPNVHEKGVPNLVCVRGVTTGVPNLCVKGVLTCEWCAGYAGHAGYAGC